MAGLLFWDVDTQHDFMHEDGRLYVPDSEAIIPNLKRLTDHAHRNGIRVVASADAHVPEDSELSDAPNFTTTFPPHCMRGTVGQRKIAETSLRNPLVIEPDGMAGEDVRRRVREHRGDILIQKRWFDVFTNPETRHVVDELDPDEIVVYGVALDVCDRYAIEGLLQRRPQTHLALVTDAAKPIVAERGAELLRDWQARGVELLTTEAALRKTGGTTARPAMTR